MGPQEDYFSLSTASFFVIFKIETNNVLEQISKTCPINTDEIELKNFWSPDGKHVFLYIDSEKKPYLLNLEDLSGDYLSCNFINSEERINPLWAPNSNWLLLYSRENVFLLNAIEGDIFKCESLTNQQKKKPVEFLDSYEKIIKIDSGFQNFYWSKDSKIFIYGTDKNFLIYDIDKLIVSRNFGIGEHLSKLAIPYEIAGISHLKANCSEEHRIVLYGFHDHKGIQKFSILNMNMHNIITKLTSFKLISPSLSLVNSINYIFNIFNNRETVTRYKVENLDANIKFIQGLDRYLEDEISLPERDFLMRIQKARDSNSQYAMNIVDNTIYDKFSSSNMYGQVMRKVLTEMTVSEENKNSLLVWPASISVMRILNKVMVTEEKKESLFLEN